ncbi:MAG TPA: glycosyltransferase [Thermoanaerobaculia bacterium]|nr:glycosyltransferase [Thermoanaerobaculia bacterium]
MPRVTVIIATYNWSSVLPYSIGSVLRQTFADFELLVIGDGCTDDSEQVVKAIGDRRIEWINLPENTRHQSGPNNEGLRRARGEFIAYLGHDDLWLPHHLEVMVHALDRTQSDLAYSLTMNVAPGGDFVWPTIPNKAAGTFASPLCVVHRRRVTEEIGGWRHYREVTNTTPDVELWRRAQAAGYKFTFVPRLTGVKLPAGHRRNVYATRPSHEQAHWSARIQNEPDFEFAQMATFVVGPAVPAGVPLSALVRNLFRQAVARLKMRRAGVVPWLGFKSRSTIDDIRKFKGL